MLVPGRRFLLIAVFFGAIIFPSNYHGSKERYIANELLADGTLVQGLIRTMPATRPRESSG
jgi:hypothetical protein